MNGRLQGFLSFLDLLAEGQRRQAEVHDEKRDRRLEAREEVGALRPRSLTARAHACAG